MGTATGDPWWQAIGDQIDAYELPFLNPLDPNYPAWPQEQRYIRLLTPPSGTRVVLTDGLGGGELPEYFVETIETADQLSGHWATNLIMEIGRFVPGSPAGIAALLSRHGVLSMEIEMDGAPPDWTANTRSESGTPVVGLFLGLPHPYRASGRPVVNAKLMRPAELRYATDTGETGRAELRERYLQQGSASVSDLDRPPVI
jgi:hypothetical protein